MASQNCPNAEALAAYVNGDLSEHLASSVIDHISRCQPCRETVDNLARQGDSVINRLRNPIGNVSPADGATVNQLMAKAEMLVAERPFAASAKSSTISIQSTVKAPVAFDIFIAELSRSGLLEQSDIDEAMESVGGNDVQTLALELVRRNKLTRYQAGLLARGKSKGLVLGNYEILDKIGQGGMGLVFKARHRRMGRTAAIKVLPSAATKSPDAVSRFRREVQTAAKLIHENIVVAHDADEADGIHFLVMEYIEGNDLARIIKNKGPLSVDHAVNCILQAARGLDYAHGLGITHRDIKPHNLLLDAQGTVKVLDLGLARLEDAIGNAADGLTNSGTVMGTVDYMSPEQALNAKYADQRSDIYSLGCTFYTLLTGRVMYEGETVMEKLLAHREQPIPKIQSHRSDVSESVVAVFQRMVAKKPEDRYQSMSEVVADLETVATGAGATMAQLVSNDPLDSVTAPIALDDTVTYDLPAPSTLPPTPAPPIIGKDSTSSPSILLADTVTYHDPVAPPVAFSESMSDSLTLTGVPTMQQAASAQTRLRRRSQTLWIAGLATVAVLFVIVCVVAIPTIVSALKESETKPNSDSLIGGSNGQGSPNGDTDNPFADDNLPSTLISKGGKGRILLVVPDNPWWPDYKNVRDAFEQRGIEVIVATPTGKSTQGNKDKIIKADLALGNANANEFDGVVFSGAIDMRHFDPGTPAAKQTKRLTDEMTKSGKLVTAICRGQLALANAGSLKNVQFANSPHVNKDILCNLGARPKNESVVVDGNIITAAADKDAFLFVKTIVSKLNEKYR